MGLTDDQIFDLSVELADALVAAFTTEETLDLMVKRSLKTPLNKIKQNARSYEATVEKVVEWAVANGKMLPLVIGASQRNPGNPKLKRFVQDNLQLLLALEPTALPNDDLLASLLQALQPIANAENFEEVVLSACTQTLPDLDASHPELRKQILSGELSASVKLLIVLELFLKTWEHNAEGQLYIVTFVQKLQLFTTGATKSALAQWLHDLPAELQPAPTAPESIANQAHPSDPALKNLQADFLISVEPEITAQTEQFRQVKVKAEIPTQPQESIADRIFQVLVLQL